MVEGQLLVHHSLCGRSAVDSEYERGVPPVMDDRATELEREDRVMVELHH